MTAFWYNPNIHPFTEYRQRQQSMERLCAEWDVPIIVSDHYDFIGYFRAVAGHERERCRVCFRLRLETTARLARCRGFSAFSTTLLISPYQNQELIKEIGNETARKEGVEFLYEDLTGGYRESVNVSKELGLYRQKYCGCLYSEWERFSKSKV